MINKKHAHFTAMVLLLIVCGCKKGRLDYESDISKFQLRTLEVFEGWDMHLDNKSRMLPFIMQMPDGQMGSWSTGGQVMVPGTAAQVNFYEVSGGQFPTSPLPDGNTAAMKFTAKKSFSRVAVHCPTYGSPNSNVTISLFAWDTDYETTVSGTPLASREFVAFPDNSEVFLESETGFSDGTYLWLLHRGVGSPAVWARIGPRPDATSFLNGSPLMSGGIESNYVSYIHTADFTNAVTYQVSGDLAATWSSEQMVQADFAAPANSSFSFPNAMRHGSYYYFNYAIASDDGGSQSDGIYLARSVSPLGAWQNWANQGWDEAEAAASMLPDAQDGKWIVRNDSLYIYYTTPIGNGNTVVAAVDISAGNWPGAVEPEKAVVNKGDDTPLSLSDVKYSDDLGQFIAVSVETNGDEAAIALWTSVDGIQFERRGDLIAENIMPSMTGVKLVGDQSGTVSLRRMQYLYGHYVTESGLERIRINPFRFRTETEIR